MTDITDLEVKEVEQEAPQKEIEIMPEAQAKHIEELIQYLIFVYNNLSASVVDHITNEEGTELIQYRVNAPRFIGMLDSLKVTAENFSKMIGAEITIEENGAEQGGAENE